MLVELTRDVLVGDGVFTSAVGPSEPVESARAEPYEQPGSHRPACRVVLARALPRLEENVVQQILRLSRLAEHARGRGEQHRRVAIVQRTEGASIGLGHPREQRRVIVRGAIRIARRREPQLRHATKLARNPSHYRHEFDAPRRLRVPLSSA